MPHSPTYLCGVINTISRDSLVCIATGYGLDDLGSVPGKGRKFVSSELQPTQPLIQWVPWALSLGVKLPERETDHTAEVTNGGAIPPLHYTSSWLDGKIYFL
jgi:hypothetical protein